MNATAAEIAEAIANLAAAAHQRLDRGDLFALLDDPAAEKRVDVDGDTYRLTAGDVTLWKALRPPSPPRSRSWPPSATS